MEIKKIHITGFGKFSNFDLDLQNDLQVIYGQNETGKSTLRQFITGILFGFAQNKKQSNNLYEPHDGSRYGGSLVLEKDGHLWTISRTGRTQSELAINDEQAQQVANPEVFLNQLLAPFTQDSFENIFSFDQEQLNEIRSLSGKELSDRLLRFSAVDADHWQSLSKNLDKNASDMFGLTKTAKRPINQLIAEHEQLAHELTVMGSELAHYRHNMDQRTQALKQINDLKNQLNDLDSRIQSFTKLVELAGLLNQKKELLQPLTNGQFSEQQIAALTDDLEQRVEKLQSQIKGVYLEKAEDKSTVIAENPLLTIYKNNRTQLDLLEKSIPSLIAENNLFDQTDNQVKNLSDRLNHLNKSLKDKFGGQIPKVLPQNANIHAHRSITTFFVIGVILALAGIAGIAKGFLTPEFPYPFWFCGAGALILGLLLAFFEHPRKGSSNLDKYQYPAGISLTTVLDSQNDLYEYEQKIQQFNELEKQKQSHVSKINSILQLASSLKKYLPSSNQAHDAFIDQIQVLLNEIKDERQSAVLSQEQRKLSDNNRQQQMNHLNQLKADQQQIFNLLAVADYKNFQALQAEKMASKQRENKLDNIKQLLTPAQEAQIQQLGGIAAISSKIQQLQSQKEDINQTIEDHNQLLLTINAALLNDSTDTDYQNKLQQKSDLETEINNSLTDYFANKLAASWINESLYQISHERMPMIKTKAEKYFAQLTANKYRQIIFDDRSLSVVDDLGEHYYSYELSKGSSEQLYVALRLAFAESVASENPLPFLIDDSFVNFDAKRKNVMDQLLNHLAADYQVIYFTANQDQNFSERNIINLGEA